MRMADISIIPNVITLGFIIGVLISSGFILFWKGESLQNKGPVVNFVMIVAFLVLIVFIAVPFIDINTKLAGTVDTRSMVRASMNNILGSTIAISIILLIVCTLMIRTNKISQDRLVFAFMCASIFISMITISIFTLEKAS
jgi:hypothetical protein